MENVGSPPAPSISFFTPLLICMLGIASTAIVIVAYHLIVVRYCLRRQASTRRASQPTSDGRLATGVEEKILETVPILAYSAKNSELFRVDQSECVVCLGELEDGAIVRLLPNCKHAFHVPCIDQWFMGHSSCPVCRSPTVAPINHETPLLENQLLPQNHSHDGDTVDDVNVPSMFGLQRAGLLRHCASLVLPMEKKPRRLVTGLKRSLSMDQSFVILEIQTDRERDFSSSSSSSNSKADLMSRSIRVQSIRHLDRVSSKLLSSFSRLRMERDKGILPY